MKKTPFSVFLLLAFVPFLFNFINQGSSNIDEALIPINQQLENDLQQVELRIQEYQDKAISFSGKTSELQQAHLMVRLAYKKVEFLLEYFNKDAIKKFINGAPLPALEKNVPEIRVIHPGGLQVLDELVFSDNPSEDLAEIQTKVRKLKESFHQISNYQRNIRLEHRHIFEACRHQLIRIFTLGVTGFDTPGSVNALPEAAVSLSVLSEVIQTYLPYMKSDNPGLRKRIQGLFKTAIQYMDQHSDFDSFDRLHFLKAFINPLFANIYQLQKQLHIESYEEVPNLPQALNLQATNIFDLALLNLNYYANLNQGDYSAKRIELGRILFYDPILSANNERSCASCHQPNKGFTDGRRKSLAINGKGEISRNAPTIINAAYAGRYFYDLREEQLERQIKHVVLDSLEFNTDFVTIVEKLQQSRKYRKLFAEAYVDFPNYQLSKWSVSNALACFVASLSSFNSPVDQYIRGERQKLDSIVRLGFNLFTGKAACGTCHFAPSFNGTIPPHYLETESEVLGVPATKDTLQPILDGDPGRIASAMPQDEAYFYAFSFKTPTVRNIALTAPYMHNGVYDTLEEVIDFYNKGGGLGLGIQIPHQTLPGTPLNLSKTEINALVKFMEALTDTTDMKKVPKQLPIFETHPEWNQRKIGGSY